MEFLRNMKQKFSRKGKKLETCYSILLFGETGSGKSTLVNYLTNFFRGGNVDNLHIAIPNQYYESTESFEFQEKDIKDRTKSKTSICTTYEFEVDGVKFRFIDTPGLADTEGVKKDDENISNIMRAAEQAGKLSAIVIVINGTVARATVNLRSTLVRMRGSLPDVLLKNLMVVLTNCTATGYNFDLKSLKPWKIPDDNVFVMNNSALSRNPKTWKKNPKAVDGIQKEWENSMDEIRKMIDRLSELGSKATGAFKNMRENRERIKAGLHEIILEINKLQQLQNELETALAEEKGANVDMERYKNYKRNKEVEYVTLVDSAYHSTLCMLHSDRICHEHCGLRYTEQSGQAIFAGCACMAGKMCRVCECGSEQHYHAMKKPQKEKKTVEEILQDVKDQFDASTNKWNEWKRKVSTLKEDLSGIKEALKIKQKKIEEYCVKLKKICTGFNFVNELKSVSDSLEANARTLTSMKAREEADDMIAHIRALADRLTGGSGGDREDSDGEDSDCEEPDEKQDSDGSGDSGEDD